jgi:hypothetical protein
MIASYAGANYVAPRGCLEHSMLVPLVSEVNIWSLQTGRAIKVRGYEPVNITNVVMHPQQNMFSFKISGNLYGVAVQSVKVFVKPNANQ